ncbi:MAG: N-formylglutamate amidohydrolase, partial [Planctomycetes bacterium]|nr:N-formylglutamate amidohydrolase [Planctomycetota bacterium]
MDTYEFTPGSTPLLVSMPHVGTVIPDAIAARMTDVARSVPDTDWHVDRLYDFATELGAAVLKPACSRYVIDLNRAPDDRALYSGARNTELCPTSTFHDQPIYRDGHAPDTAEIAERRATYWHPYHDRLADALADIREEH